MKNKLVIIEMFYKLIIIILVFISTIWLIENTPKIIRLILKII